MEDMTEPTLDGLKEVLNADDLSLQPGYATLCLYSAKQWLQNAGVSGGANQELYTLAVYMLAAHWYDHRGVAEAGVSLQDIPLGVVSIIHQLRDESVT